MIGYTPAEQAIRAGHGESPATGADKPWHGQRNPDGTPVLAKDETEAAA